MKKILLTVLLASIGLIAGDNVPAKKTGGFLPFDAAALYQKKCAVCHGKDGRKVPSSQASVLAGRDAARLSREIIAYRDQFERVGAYAKTKESEIMYHETFELADNQISALAKYISEL